MAPSPLTTPARRAGSVRRTSSIDMTPYGEVMGHGFRLVGRARDLVTDATGGGSVAAEAEVVASIVEGTVTELSPAVDGLTGLAAGRGFRAKVGELLRGDAEAHTPRYLLLDDLPVAALISGYADLYHGPIELSSNDGSASIAVSQADICAGWASEATMIRTIVEEGYFPVPRGPEASEGASDDDLAWHALDALDRGAMRRRRRIDVWADGDELLVDAMFRDTHVDPDGTETVLHEWWVDATIDRERALVTSCTARPGPLPWTECPGAAMSATRLVGHEAGELRSFVRADLRGTSTCTHLNDLLRSLADVPALGALLE